jgi:hypothetical protein
MVASQIEFEKAPASAPRYPLQCCWNREGLQILPQLRNAVPEPTHPEQRLLKSIPESVPFHDPLHVEAFTCDPEGDRELPPEKGVGFQPPLKSLKVTVPALPLLVRGELLQELIQGHSFSQKEVLSTWGLL